MALKTDDCDIRDVRMFMEHGGNGDYYMNLIEYPKGYPNNQKGIVQRLNMRMAMSGGNAPHEVKMAFVALYRAMEAAKLNEHPKNEEVAG